MLCRGKCGAAVCRKALRFSSAKWGARTNALQMQGRKCFEMWRRVVVSCAHTRTAACPANTVAAGSGKRRCEMVRGSGVRKMQRKVRGRMVGRWGSGRWGRQRDRWVVVVRGRCAAAVLVHRRNGAGRWGRWCGMQRKGMRCCGMRQPAARRKMYAARNSAKRSKARAVRCTAYR